uniref:Uncharacterized protein n=1 Tax=Myripristis murdjan TaxID=586833 RepID=A0A667X6Y1_9TELE
MDSLVKKSLRKPIRKLTSCVSGVKEREVWVKHGKLRSRGGGCRGCNRSGKSPPSRTAHTKDLSAIRSYQADLEKERQLREAMNAQKNAERAAMRAHFRRKYQLLAKMIHPENKTKDDGYNLLSAFQGLSFNVGVVRGSKQSRTRTPTRANGDPCKVM